MNKELSIACAALALAFQAGTAAIDAGNTGDMNILLIVAEDWSAFAMGHNGNPVVQTPVLDELAARSVIFDRAYCQAPVCNPSRASLITGLRPDSTRVYGNDDDMDDYIPDGAPDMGSIMKQRGGPTATIGKIVHKWKDSARFINGFDILEYTHDYDLPDGYNGRAAIVPRHPEGPLWAEDEAFFLAEPHRSILWELKEEREQRKANGEPDTWALRKPFQQYHAEQLGDSNLPEEAMEDGRLSRRTVELLGELSASDKPFFLAVGLYATHTPLLAPKEYVDLYDPETLELSPAQPELDRNIPDVARRFGQNYDVFNGLYPQFAKTPRREREALAAYYACASFLDAQIGIILEGLEATGEADNTIVIFVADHGFHLGEHGMWSKFSLFEQSTRVPLMVHVPGAPANGRRCDEIVEMVDILPTLCDLWSLEKDPVFEGNSFLPLLQDPGQPWKTAAFSAIPIRGLGRMVRTREFRYSEWRKDTSWPGEGEAPYARELYSITRDPLEQDNLIDNPLYQEKVRELSRLLAEGHPAARPPRS